VAIINSIIEFGVTMSLIRIIMNHPAILQEAPMFDLPFGELNVQSKVVV